jgi:hypothetical protein
VTSYVLNLYEIFRSVYRINTNSTVRDVFRNLEMIVRILAFFLRLEVDLRQRFAMSFHHSSLAPFASFPLDSKTNSESQQVHTGTDQKKNKKLQNNKLGAAERITLRVKKHQKKEPNSFITTSFSVQ